MARGRLKEYLERHRILLEAKFVRDGQAPIDGKFWIARRISMPVDQFQHFFGVPFRHPTPESATTEAERMARVHPGETYGIFEFTGLTFLVASSVKTKAKIKTLEAVE